MKAMRVAQKFIAGCVFLGAMLLAGCGESPTEETSTNAVEENVDTATNGDTEPKPMVEFETLAGEISSDIPSPAGITILGILGESQVESATGPNGLFSLSFPKGSDRPEHILSWSSDFQYVGEQSFGNGRVPDQFVLSMEKTESISGSVKNLVSREVEADATVMFWFGERDRIDYSSLTSTGSEGKFSLPAISGISMFARAYQGDLVSRIVEVAPGEKLELGLLREVAPLVQFHDPSGKVEFPIVVSFESSTGDIFLLETDIDGVVDLLGTPRGEIYLLGFPSIDFVAQPPVLQTWNDGDVLLAPKP